MSSVFFSLNLYRKHLLFIVKSGIQHFGLDEESSSSLEHCINHHTRPSSRIKIAEFQIPKSRDETITTIPSTTKTTYCPFQSLTNLGL